jgi:hypothetical protein
MSDEENQKRLEQVFGFTFNFPLSTFYCPLLPFPFRGTFLEECCHAFFLVFGAEQGHEVFAFKLETSVQTAIEGSVHGVLGEPDCEWCSSGNLRGKLQGLREVRFDWHNPRDETNLECFKCSQISGIQNHFHRQAFANGSGQALRAARARNDAEVDFGLPKSGSFAGKNDVAEHRQLEATTEAKSADGGDGRLGEFSQSSPGIHMCIGQHLRDAFAGHFGNIGPGSEGAIRAGQHHATHGIVTGKSIKSRNKLEQRGLIECVQNLRPVDADQYDMLEGLHQQIREFHV